MKAGPKGRAAQRQHFRSGPRTWAAPTHSMWDGSDPSTVPGLDRVPTQEAEQSGSSRVEFQVDLRVRGRRFPLLLCMSYRPYRPRTEARPPGSVQLHAARTEARSPLFEQSR
jgi:hypothetical protein